MKNLLMIAFHYPPARVSSGVQRTLKFSSYLLDHGWRAHILTAQTKAYERVCAGQINEIPHTIKVQRTFALDTAKHLAIKGKYLLFMALPDRWVSWCIDGVLSGVSIIKRTKPEFIWSTYPIASAHLIALILHRLTKIPWVADFRDSMWDESFPTNATQRKVFVWLEKKIIKHCCCAVFTTKGAIALYQQRYPEIPDSKWLLIPNGYDEENFIRAENSEVYKNALAQKNTGKLVLVHSGVLYPSERDPRHFFKAIAELKRKGMIAQTDLKIILRSTGHDVWHDKLIKAEGIDDIVFLEPSLSYQEALMEMLLADGLLLFQAANCNHQIPAKIYEYFRAGKPIFALTDSLGDTAAVLRSVGVEFIVPLDCDATIAQKLPVFLQQLRHGSIQIINAEKIKQHSREYSTLLLSNHLNRLLRNK